MLDWLQNLNFSGLMNGEAPQWDIQGLLDQQANQGILPSIPIEGDLSEAQQNALAIQNHMKEKDKYNPGGQNVPFTKNIGDMLGIYNQTSGYNKGMERIRNNQDNFMSLMSGGEQNGFGGLLPQEQPKPSPFIPQQRQQYRPPWMTVFNPYGNRI